MTSLLSTSYDEIPYESFPLYSAHPNSLAVAGRLRGIETAAPSRCRMLELGCGNGGNLIPVAYGLPDSRFVGVDLSHRQIEEGQGICRQMEMSNIELRAGSILDVDQSWGEFDYIVCHGVFSWVPKAVQDRILWICRRLLVPQGVAYVSYNTYPGWNLRSVVRELMKFHTAKYSDPEMKVQQARSILNFIGQAAANRQNFLGRILMEDAKDLAEQPNYYLFHEHLEEANQPFYLHQFAALARAEGLEYLGEAWDQFQIDDLPKETQEILENISEDVVELEQYLDFIRCRTFRRTLLCHRETRFEHAPALDKVEPFFVAPFARPKSDKPDIVSAAPEEFITANDTSITTNNPLWKAALVCLADEFPGAMSFDDLLAQACKRACVSDGLEDARSMLAVLLMRGYVSHLLSLQCEPFPLTNKLSARPRASKLARVLSVTRSKLPTLRHEAGRFSPAERLVLRLVDGTRSKEQLIEDARKEVLPLLETEKSEDGSPPVDVATFVDQCLKSFRQAAMLEA